MRERTFLMIATASMATLVLLMAVVQIIAGRYGWAFLNLGFCAWNVHSFRQARRLKAWP